MFEDIPTEQYIKNIKKRNEFVKLLERAICKSYTFEKTTERMAYLRSILTSKLSPDMLCGKDVVINTCPGCLNKLSKDLIFHLTFAGFCKKGKNSKQCIIAESSNMSVSFVKIKLVKDFAFDEQKQKMTTVTDTLYTVTHKLSKQEKEEYSK